VVGGKFTSGKRCYERTSNNYEDWGEEMPEGGEGQEKGSNDWGGHLKNRQAKTSMDRKSEFARSHRRRKGTKPGEELTTAGGKKN